MHTDWRGTELTVGATVVYPTRSGSSMNMNEGTVLSLTEKEGYYGRKYLEVKVLGKGNSRPGIVDEHRVTVVT